LAAAAQSRSDERQYTSWDRARLSVVVPIGVIVAIAIICIVVAVLTSAWRTDKIAVEQERDMLAREISMRGERILRELESISASDSAVRNIRNSFDASWIQSRVGSWLENYFDHDYVFVIDPRDLLVYSLAGRTQVQSNRMEMAQADLGPLLDYLRSRGGVEESRVIHIERNEAAPAANRMRPAALLQTFAGRPAIVSAAPIGAAAGVLPSTSEPAPALFSVKFIDQEMIEEIATRMRVAHLRLIGMKEPIPASETDLTLTDHRGEPIARLAWTPRQPGAEIVDSVVPFVTVAFAGFALLAAFVLRYMRRTAATIAAGESRLRHLAMHDPLCGLPNRIFFGERLEAVIDEVRNGRAPAAVFYIDLDHFKEVNDTLGHPVGDELIRNVTLRLSRTLRGDDLVARLGGDEFAVISGIGADTGKIMMLANRIIAALAAPYAINKQTIVIGASIGIAIIDRNCCGAADIMRYADMALYRAKNEGRNRACIYDAVMDADLSNRKLLEADLRFALEKGELRLLYQPLVNNSGETVVGVEALCRWTHPTRGDISPSEFIAIAEHSGLIIELGEWVLRRACTDAKAWPGLTLAVNVSPLQFRRADFVTMVEQIIAETQFDPKRLELEVTETTLIGNVETAESAMLRLKQFGVKLALDDFGTGYSSLQYLRRFPFDKLKIDRSFVHSIERAADAAAIVHAIVSLGRGLGMKVIAEGVETADQHLFLRAAGVHMMQGYRFGKAVSTDEITMRLKNPASFRPVDEPAALAS